MICSVLKGQLDQNIVGVINVNRWVGIKTTDTKNERLLRGVSHVFHIIRVCDNQRATIVVQKFSSRETLMKLEDVAELRLAGLMGYD
jgi:hypothetical protein